MIMDLEIIFKKQTLHESQFFLLNIRRTADEILLLIRYTYLSVLVTYNGVYIYLSNIIP